MTSPQNQPEQLSGSKVASAADSLTTIQRTQASLRGATSELLVAPQQGSGDENKCDSTWFESLIYCEWEIEC